MYRPFFGLATVFKPEAGPAEMVRQLQRFGFNALELDLPYLKRHANELGVLTRALARLTFHLPHDGKYSALSADPADDGTVLEQLRPVFEEARSVGCSTFTFHLKNPLGQRIESYWSRSVDFARRLGTLAREFDAMVGLENCYPVVRDGETARRFLTEVDVPEVGLTLDTGHFWSALAEDDYGHHRENPVMRTEEGNALLNRMCTDMVRAVGERVVNMHIHNLRAEDWRDHQPVDAGVMQYEEFFSILRGQGYDRTVIVEIRATEGWLGFESSARFLERFR
jgi:sugar phosphate isomerase/epimerase